MGKKGGRDEGGKKGEGEEEREKERGGERNKATKAELEDSWLYIERMCLLSQR